MPLFDRILRSDIFVYLDDVEFSKNGFHNRNWINTFNGPLLLTVPVLYKKHSRSYISNIGIDNSQKWKEKHWRTIVQNYSKAPYFSELSPKLRDVYSQDWNILGDLNIELIEIFCGYLGIKVKRYMSSKLNVEGRSNEKLVNTCKKMGADKFLVKPNTKHYHPPEYFESNGIKCLEFQYQNIEYSQMHREFIPNLSVLDYAMNCGPKLWAN